MLPQTHQGYITLCRPLVVLNSISFATFSMDLSAKPNVARLDKGELVISHATFRQPVKIQFPRPAYRQEGVEG
jgi:hypothetical protein